MRVRVSSVLRVCWTALVTSSLTSSSTRSIKSRSVRGCSELVRWCSTRSEVHVLATGTDVAIGRNLVETIQTGSAGCVKRFPWVGGRGGRGIRRATPVARPGHPRPGHAFPTTGRSAGGSASVDRRSPSAPAGSPDSMSTVGGLLRSASVAETWSPKRSEDELCLQIRGEIGGRGGLTPVGGAWVGFP
jgi:hypothetical protein